MTLGAEFKGAPNRGKSEVLFVILRKRNKKQGMKMRFMAGVFTGNFSSSLKACGTLTHHIDNFLAFALHGTVDFKQPENNSCFGISLSVGGM